MSKKKKQLAANSQSAALESKIKTLQRISEGGSVSSDTSDLKSRLALFLLNHADKVMDTVVPLEALRDELTETFLSKAHEVMDDPESTAGQIFYLIDAIQQMNNYSLNSVKSILDQEKLTTYISIDASDRSTNVQQNTLNLDSAQSRARVLKAISMINRAVSEEPSEVIDNNS